jgi:rubrerythrin
MQTIESLKQQFEWLTTEYDKHRAELDDLGERKDTQQMSYDEAIELGSRRQQLLYVLQQISIDIYTVSQQIGDAQNQEQIAYCRDVNRQFLEQNQAIIALLQKIAVELNCIESNTTR